MCVEIRILSAHACGSTYPYSAIKQSGLEKKHEYASDLAPKGAPPENRRDALSVLPAIFKWAVESEW